MKLCNATLSDLPGTIKRPTYDRSRLTAGIVHVGLGNFHRAHQSWYLHRLFEQGLNRDWAIVGAGVRAYDAQMRQKLKAQDYLTTLIELDPSGVSAEVIGPMIDYVPVEENNAALIARIAAPDIRIVALTVTEGGYYIDPVGNRFDATHPDIRHDALNPSQPHTAFGAIVAALKLRRDRAIGPLSCLSCDNLQGNGHILHQTVTSLARLSDPALADWIDANCSFPNSMVDCIVPATGPKEIALARSLGVEDAVPVTHENFRQWVIEDHFCAGRPDWDKVGATFSDRVKDYETMKIRILNAGHQVIVNSAEILGIETISATMAHPKIRALFRKVELDEIVPHVKPVPGMTPENYVDLIERRFSNPAIVDTVRRVAFDGSSRHTGMVLPVVRDGLAAGVPVEGLALVEAAWARMCAGSRENGTVIEPNDPFWDDLVAAATAARRDPRAWLEMRNNYGDLADRPRFAEAFGGWLTMIWADGIEAAIDAYCSSGSPSGT
jgi:mannitol 2-dehydrogenase